MGEVGVEVNPKKKAVLGSFVLPSRVSALCNDKHACFSLIKGFFVFLFFCFFVFLFVVCCCCCLLFAVVVVVYVCVFGCWAYVFFCLYFSHQ